jgi:6-pyruvoyltetrahydropterin/6-carboxytetrahydropterin synthase
MHYLTRLAEFEASHRYWNSVFSDAENHSIFGKCTSPYGHGHNYILRVTLSGKVDVQTGMVMNIRELDRILKEVLSEFDHKFINLDHPAFHHCVPTTENLASYMKERIETKLHTDNDPYQIARLTLYEEPTLWADAFPGEGKTMLSLTKVFAFSAAHRLHSQSLSEDENRTVFGKCNNPHGHGHNYELEVTVQGTTDPRTGMIMDLGFLMQVVQEEVIERFDHKHLNEDTREFRTLNPTGENIVKVIWDLLRPRLGHNLKRIGLWETPKNFFEYYGE